MAGAVGFGGVGAASGVEDAEFGARGEGLARVIAGGGFAEDTDADGAEVGGHRGLERGTGLEIG
jgi:hypothetical protein